MKRRRLREGSLRMGQEASSEAFRSEVAQDLKRQNARKLVSDQIKDGMRSAGKRTGFNGSPAVGTGTTSKGRLESQDSHDIVRSSL
jgi:hypothetical protein